MSRVAYKGIEEIDDNARTRRTRNDIAKEENPSTLEEQILEDARLALNYEELEPNHRLTYDKMLRDSINEDAGRKDAYGIRDAYGHGAYSRNDASNRVNTHDEEDIYDRGIVGHVETKLDKQYGNKNKKSLSKRHMFWKIFIISLSMVLICVISYKAWDAISYKVSTDRSMKKLKALAECILVPVEAEVAERHREMDLVSGGTRVGLPGDGGDVDGSITTNNTGNGLDGNEGQGGGTEKLPDIRVGISGVLHKYSMLYGMNDDMVGWIKIEGTVINYPVMQTKEDEEYYLYRNFDKENDITGLPFLDVRSDISLTDRSSNILVHAHNMKNGTMFAPLLKYKDEKFYREHDVIQFDTIYEEAYYEIVAVFLTRVAYQHEDIFRYYSFIDTDSKEEYDAFIKEIKRLSYHDTGIWPEYGDDLITLSTCDRSITDGRLVVVGRKRV